MHRSLWITLLIAGLFLSPVLPVASQESVMASETYIPFVPYRGVPQSQILYPRLMTPVYIQPGMEIEIYTLLPDVSEVWLVDNVYGVEIQLEIIDGPIQIVEDRSESAVETYYRYVVGGLGEDAPPSIYNLVLKTGAGESYEEINAVFIPNEMQLDPVIKVAHISDVHIGGYGGQYKYAYMYFDRALYTIQAMGADVIVNTGDFLEQQKKRGLEHIYNMFDHLTIPVVSAMGNTDNVFNNRGDYYWERVMGPDFGVAVLPNMIIIPLNFETGDISVDYVYEWLAKTVENYRSLGFRFVGIMGHYPHWDMSVVSQRLVDNFRQINQQYGIDIAFHGHVHRVENVLVNTTGIFAVSSTSTAYGKVFNGFRWVELNVETGEINADKSNVVNLDETYVEYTWFNDFKKRGMSVEIRNGGGEELTLRLPINIMYTGEPSITTSGGVVASLISSETVETDDGEGLALIVEARIGPNSEGVLTVVSGVDEEPPVVVGEPKLIGFKQYNIINFNVDDDASGVASIVVQYKTDGEWIDAEWVEKDSWLYPAVPRDIESFTVKIILTDYLGNSAEYMFQFGEEQPAEEPSEETPDTGGEQPEEPATEQPTETPPEEPTEEPSEGMDLTLMAVLAALLVVAVAIFLFLRRR